jgi:hypothetical protein
MSKSEVKVTLVQGVVQGEICNATIGRAISPIITIYLFLLENE